ncbi:DUF2461 domain-containing protein [Aquirufa rosea]|uniref:DUF2461 domain-containing protein n=1 Tax=Aquirufa rosea TaxID=2509241 RepID=A0A4Q1C2N6_9BACT|nr:DUF2461 domain-containing protein [Aquirufa rosea]RXK52331.1 DUF2461 domain-containing protein [Aquirufa rosea]
MFLPASLFSFLSDLKENNTREWFGENKERYLVQKSAFDQFTVQLIQQFGEFENMDGVELKHCSYRIYRDVRFSKDKSPYKTWFSASFSEGGRKSGLMDYYLHIEPGGKSFLGGGMYEPSPEQLAIFRQEVDYNAPQLKNIIFSTEFVKVFGDPVGESLKKMPKGYDINHPEIELLKRKQLFFWHKYADSEVCDPQFAEHLIHDAQILKPFLDFLNAIFFDKEPYTTK